MTQRKTLIKRTPLRKVERRDCRTCGKRVEKRYPDAGWAHVRTPISPHQPDPYKTKRTPKRTSLMRQADALWSQIVKAPGVCAAREDRQHATVMRYVFCDGVLEAAHVVPRRHRSTRWLPENGRPLCSAHHRYFTGSEKAWRDFIGPEWDRLWTLALRPWDRTFPTAELRALLAKEAA